VLALLAAATGNAEPQEVIDILLAPFATRGAGITFTSGSLGIATMATGGTGQDISVAVDRGVAIGFLFAAPFAMLFLVVGLT
jgi:hypothetical protein